MGSPETTLVEPELSSPSNRLIPKVRSPKTGSSFGDGETETRWGFVHPLLSSSAGSPGIKPELFNPTSRPIPRVGGSKVGSPFSDRYVEASSHSVYPPLHAVAASPVINPVIADSRRPILSGTVAPVSPKLVSVIQDEHFQASSDSLSLPLLHLSEALPEVNPVVAQPQRSTPNRPEYSEHPYKFETKFYTDQVVHTSEAGGKMVCETWNSQETPLGAGGQGTVFLQKSDTMPRRLRAVKQILQYTMKTSGRDIKREVQTLLAVRDVCDLH